MLRILGRFIAYGLHPGQFGEYLLLDQRISACQMHIGPYIKGRPFRPDEQAKIDAIDRMCDWLSDHIPQTKRFTHAREIWKWANHSGLEGADLNTKVMFQLITPNWWNDDAVLDY